MTRTENVEAAFDRQADSFDGIYSGNKIVLGRFWDRATRRNIHQRHKRTITLGAPWKNKRVLDVGCGSGRYCVDAVQQGAVEVVGIDLSEKMLSIAEKLAEDANVHKRCKFIRANILEFNDAQGFDTIIANGFFDYVPETSNMLSKLSSLTNRVLIATFPCKWAFRVIPRRIWWRVKNGCELQFFDRNDLNSLCRQVGLEVITLERLGPIYLLVANKQ